MNAESKKYFQGFLRRGCQIFFVRAFISRHQSQLRPLNFTTWFLILACCSFLLSSCRLHSGSEEITVAGSTSIQPFADEWAELFMRKKPGLVINIQGGGSSAGIMAVREGSADIGMSSRELKDDEKSLSEIIVAYDGLAIIVHPSNPVSSLTIDQVRSIFAGEIVSWKILNGVDKNITVVVREEGSGTRGAFQEMVMGQRRISKKAIVEDSNGVVREIVSHDRNSIGFISLGLVNDKVKAIAQDGIEPTEEAILKREYRLIRPFLFLTREKPEGLPEEFIDFVLSDEIQSRLPQDGLIPVKKIMAGHRF
ncbi:MAG: phosphate ABC transporter substrate-binding protein [Acidobacteriota bacterium]|nr:phosphate ABC transporter substrate-binding protein [Acidobacteriota bacterium]